MKYLFIRLKGDPGLTPKVRTCFDNLKLKKRNLVVVRDLSEKEVKGYFNLLTPFVLMLELSPSVFEDHYEKVTSLNFPHHIEPVSKRKLNLRESFEKVTTNTSHVNFFIKSLIKKNDK